MRITASRMRNGDLFMEQWKSISSNFDARISTRFIIEGRSNMNIYFLGSLMMSFMKKNVGCCLCIGTCYKKLVVCFFMCVMYHIISLSLMCHVFTIRCLIPPIMKDAILGIFEHLLNGCGWLRINTMLMACT